MSTTDVLVLRPAAAPRRQVLMITAVISVVLVVAGVLAGGRPALITCVGLVVLLAATIAVYLWRSRIVVTPAENSARGLTTDAPDGPVTMPQLARERPGTVGWIGRHPVAVALLCALGFAVAALVLGTVIAALTG